MTPVEAAVEALLAALDVPDDPELAGTPGRVAKLWRETLLGGYDRDPAAILADGIPDTSGAIVTLTRIPFHCVCPHHLVPAIGEVHLAYEPGGVVIGLGALEELVCALSRRLVLQERLTRDLVDALMTHLGARGAACAIEASHLCLILRGREPRAARVHTRHAAGSLVGRSDVLPGVQA
ncbi:MAG: GTP cyclohydrolase I [Myxococcales bacterium]|nr:GTP cyclohydrolase I [Myxococcales bacterium]